MVACPALEAALVAMGWGLMEMERGFARVDEIASELVDVVSSSGVGLVRSCFTPGSAVVEDARSAVNVASSSSRALCDVWSFWRCLW